jgi:hypothetical protein
MDEGRALVRRVDRGLDGTGERHAELGRDKVDMVAQHQQHMVRRTDAERLKAAGESRPAVPYLLVGVGARGITYRYPLGPTRHRRFQDGHHGACRQRPQARLPRSRGPECRAHRGLVGVPAARDGGSRGGKVGGRF